jgi:hypothetical protein
VEDMPWCRRESASVACDLIVTARGSSVSATRENPREIAGAWVAAHRDMRASYLLLLLIAVGCGSHDAPPDAGSPPPPSSTALEAPVQPPPPPPEPTIVTQGQYYAVFLGDELDRCIERTRRYEIPFGVAWAPRDLAPIEPVPEGRVIELATDCASSFEGRTVLASCDGSSDLASYDGLDAGIGEPPSGVTMIESVTSRNYRFATALENDVRLEECLAMQHRWTAVPDTSPEFARARSHAHVSSRSPYR